MTFNHRCPVCGRGTIQEDRTCSRCGVGMPRDWPYAMFDYPPRALHITYSDRESTLINYIETKADKA